MKDILLFSAVMSATLKGLQVEFVQVEADVSNGLPMFHMVGCLSSEVKEAGERVRTAVKNSGFGIPTMKVVVNLSPANMRKKGNLFDLPVAIAILKAVGVICGEDNEKNFSESWKREWEKGFKTLKLSKEEQKDIILLNEGIGLRDKDSQIKQIELYLLRLENSIDAMKVIIPFFFFVLLLKLFDLVFYR